MPTSYHENCSKPVESRPESSRESYNRKKKRGFLKRSKTVHSQSAPTSPHPDRRTKTVGSSPGFPEPRYNKSVNLLIEARRVAKELEEKREKGELFRSVYRSSLNYGRKVQSRYQDRARSNNNSHEDLRSQRESSPFLRAELLRAKADLRQSLTNGKANKKDGVILVRRCEECGRSISNGLYSEHRGKPYCNVPCYSMLFSPLTCGLHEKTSEDGDVGNGLSEEQEKLRNALVPKLRIYNTYYAEKPSQISCREEDSQLILAGVLKVYWGLKHPVTLEATDTSYWRNFHPENGLKRGYPYQCGFDEVDGKRNDSKPVNRSYSVGNNKRPGTPRETSVAGSSPANPVVQNGTSMTRRRRTTSSARYRKLKVEKTSFVPPYGTPTTLRLTNKVFTPNVVKMLLQKFQISDRAEKFTLFIVYESGGVRKLQADDKPLVIRVNLGPCEDVAKIFIMEAADQKEIPHEVAQYGRFAMHELENFLIKFKEEEEREVEKLKERCRKYKEMLETRIADIERASPVTRL